MHPASTSAIREVMNLGITHVAVMIAVGLLTARTDCHQQQQQKEYFLDRFHFYPCSVTHSQLEKPNESIWLIALLENSHNSPDSEKRHVLQGECDWERRINAYHPFHCHWSDSSRFRLIGHCDCKTHYSEL